LLSVEYANEVTTFTLLGRSLNLEHLTLHFCHDFVDVFGSGFRYGYGEHRQMLSTTPSNLEQTTIAYLRRLRGLKSVTFQINEGDDIDDYDVLFDYEPTGMLTCDGVLRQIREEICQPRDV